VSAPAARPSLLPDAPLIFRVAAWPIETLHDLRSPAFAAAVDALLAGEAAVAAAAETLSEDLARAVPRTPDRRQRAVLLRVRRFLFGSRAPLPAADLALVVAMAQLDAHVRARIARDDEVRRRLHETRQELRHRHAATTAAERAALFAVAGERRFRNALIVASPSAGARWEAMRGSGATEIDDRLTATIWRYVMRAVGRATPHSLWAGVTIEDVGPADRDEPLTSRDAPPVVRVKPDLNVLHTALMALARHPRVRRRLTFRANPSLARHRRGRWRYLHEVDALWAVVDSAEGARIDRLRALLHRDGPMTLAQIATRSGIDIDALTPLLDAGVLWPDVDWPPVCTDPWEALDGLCARLPAADRRRWGGVVERLREICGELAASCWDGSPAGVARALGEARAAMNGLLRRYGAEPLGSDRSPLVFDLIAPFRIAASNELRQRLGEAVRRCCRFDRGGAGEVLARGARRRRDPAILCQALALGGLRPGPGAEPPSAPLAGQPPAESWEAEAWQLDDGKIAEEFLTIVRVWTDALAPHAARQAVVVSHLATSADAPLPPGAALALVRFGAGQPVVRVGSISPDVGAFYARFHHHAETGPSVFARWQADLVSAVGRVGGLRPSDCAFRGAHDRNAALRPRLTAHLLDPFAACRVEYEAGRDGADRLHLRGRGARERTIPLINSAADLSRAEPCSAWLQAQAHLLGRPTLLRPLPPLAEELRTWRHLPQLELDGGVVISGERWHMAADEAAAWAALPAFERFVAWRRIVATRRLPDLVYAHHGPHRTESLMPADSVLAVDMLARSVRAYPGALRWQAPFARPDDLWLRDARGACYLAEVAVAWAGDEAFWRELAVSGPGPAPGRESRRAGSRGPRAGARRRPRASGSRR
jgi:hypothetical protein